MKGLPNIPVVDRTMRKDGRKRRARSTKAATEALRAAIVAVVEGSAEKINVRRIAYLLADQGVIASDKYDFQRVEDQALKLRRMGRVDDDAIIDETRRCIEEPSWDDLPSFLDGVIPQFRTNPWKDKPFRIYAVAEKNGLAPVVQPITDRYLVPLYPTGGYNGDGRAMVARQAHRGQSGVDANVLPAWRSR